MSSVLEKAYDEAKEILPIGGKSDAKSAEAIQQEQLEAVVDEEIQNETQPKNVVQESWATGAASLEQANSEQPEAPVESPKPVQTEAPKQEKVEAPKPA